MHTNKDLKKKAAYFANSLLVCMEQILLRSDATTL